jgi:hypothetical protein
MKNTIIYSLILIFFVNINLMSNENEKNVSLNIYNEKIELYNNMKNVLDEVSKNNIKNKYSKKSQKWDEIKITLNMLIEKNLFDKAYVIFSLIELDFELTNYKNYYYFFNIVKSLETNDVNFNKINLIKNKILLNKIYEYSFILISEEKIEDVNILSKMNSSLIEINNYLMPFDNKQRIRYKMNILKGNYLESYNIIHTIEEKNQEDKKYLNNINNILKLMESIFFEKYLNLTHKEFLKLNLSKKGEK